MGATAPSTNGELCVGLCVSRLGSSQQGALSPQAHNWQTTQSDRTWVSARMEMGMKMSLSPAPMCSFHVPHMGQTEWPDSPPAPVFTLAPVKGGLNNSWPMHVAQSWGSFLVAQLERG